MPLEPYQLISQYTLEPLLKAEAERFRCVSRAVRLRVPVAVAECRGSHRRPCGKPMARQPRSARNIIVGCDGGGSAVRKQLGDPASRRRQPPAPASGPLLLPGSVRHDPDRRRAGARAALPHRRCAIDVPDHAGLDEALDAARRRGQSPRRWRRSSSGRSVCRSLRHALRRRVEAEPAARRSLSAAAASFSPAMRFTW